MRPIVTDHSRLSSEWLGGALPFLDAGRWGRIRLEVLCIYKLEP